MAQYYDLILALIPMVLVGIGGVLLVAGIEQTIAIPLAGMVAVGLIGHAIFVNGPVDTVAEPAPEQTSSTGSVAPNAD